MGRISPTFPGQEPTTWRDQMIGIAVAVLIAALVFAFVIGVFALAFQLARVLD